MTLADIYYQGEIKTINQNERLYSGYKQEVNYFNGEKFLSVNGEFYEFKLIKSAPVCTTYECYKASCGNFFLINKISKEVESACLGIVKIAKIIDKKLIFKLLLSKDYFELYEEEYY